MRFNLSKRNKYNAIQSGGSRSKLEDAVNEILKLREKAGELKIYKREQHINLLVRGVKLIGYRPDFTCFDIERNEYFWVEAKGKATSDLLDWKIKSVLWGLGGPGRLEVWMGSARSPVLVKTIIPDDLNSSIDIDQVFGKLE